MAFPSFRCRIHLAKSRPQWQGRWTSSYLKEELADAEYAKIIRKPEGFFRQIIAGVKHDLHQKKEIRGDPKLAELLNDSQRRMYQESILISATSSAPVMAKFLRANVGLPLFGNTVFAHAHAGLSQYVMDNHAIGTLRDSLNICTYYRTPVLVEDLISHFGFSTDDICNIVAKNFFSQYWARDPAIFNPMVRSYYPLNSHITHGGTDLGREPEFQGARLFAYGVEGKKAPVTIVNCGDTGVFTDGNMSMLQHMIEARERGYDFPLIVHISSNNSSISTRLASDSAGAVSRIEQRLHLMGITEGDVTDANDVVAGIKSMRSAVDNVRAGGGPRYVIMKYPFRPVGHASDASTAADDLILQQFHAFKKSMVDQLSMACNPMAGSQLADMVAEFEDKMEVATQHALSGVHVYRRPQIEELSAPGSAKLALEAGQVIDLEVTYVLNKGMKEFAGLGADIYSKVLNTTMNELHAQQRVVRYVHQENHVVNASDTRGGVYGELNHVNEELLTNFVNFMPNEAQVAQVAAGLRTMLPNDSVVFCKGPHTLFNEHAKDFLKYAAYRHCDVGEVSNTIYLMDGGSLAEKESMSVDTPEGPVKRDLVLARVGEHHNTPLYSGYAFDANILLAVPLDVNVFAAMLPAIIQQYNHGRQLITFLPTNLFGALHPVLKAVEGKTLGPHDVMRIEYKHSKSKGTVKPLNGRNLVVISWGPDSRWVCKYLVEKKIECTQLILNYIHPANALKTYLRDHAHIPTEVVVVDPNPHAALLGPILTDIKRELLYPDMLYFSECTIRPAYSPWGNGESLLGEGDLEAAFATRGIIDAPGYARPVTSTPTPVSPTPTLPRAPVATPEPAAGKAVTVKELFVCAPMDADSVQIRFSVKPGATVAEDDVIAEIESDKATIEVTAPCNGVVEEFFVNESVDMNVTTETRIAKIRNDWVEPQSEPVETNVTVYAPFVADSAVVSFRKSVGDPVTPDEVVADIESDKATIEVTAPCAGVIDTIACKEGVEIKITEETKIFEMVVAVEALDAPSSFAPTSTIASISDPLEPTVIPLSKLQRQMVENMTVKITDTHSFAVSERMHFQPIVLAAKSSSTSPSTVLLKHVGDCILALNINRKLTDEKMGFVLPKTIDLGMAVDVDGQLRVAVLRDVPNKSVEEIGEEIRSMVARGKYLSLKDQDLSTVCYTLSSLGKAATEQVYPTLIRGTTGIIGVGRQDAEGRASMHMTCCHATLTGLEGANLLRRICEFEK